MFLRAPFEEKNRIKILSFLERQSFATLISGNGFEAPIASHLPVDILPDENANYGKKIITHLANKNPHLPFFSDDNEVLIIFLDHSNYISPSWFENKKSAPTQSHIAVHAYGMARVITDSKSLLEIMTHQVKTRENKVGQSWSIDNLGEDGLHSRLGQISGVEIKLDRIEASFRLLQDESRENIEGVLNSASLDDKTREEICRANCIDANKALQRTSR